MDTEGGGRATLAAPLNGLANHAKPEIGSDFGGFVADRGRDVVTCSRAGRGTSRENVKDGGWREGVEKEEFSTFELSQFAKIVGTAPI